VREIVAVRMDGVSLWRPGKSWRAGDRHVKGEVFSGLLWRQAVFALYQGTGFKEIPPSDPASDLVKTGTLGVRVPGLPLTHGDA
jgi:hypothetical protein